MSIPANKVVSTFLSRVLSWQRKGEMGELQEQLSILRQRIARIDEKYAGLSSIPRPLTDVPSRPLVEDLELVLSVGEVDTSFGRQFETEKLYEHHRHHGSADIGALADPPHDLLETISDGSVLNVPL